MGHLRYPTHVITFRLYEFIWHCTGSVRFIAGLLFSRSECCLLCELCTDFYGTLSPSSRIFLWHGMSHHCVPGLILWLRLGKCLEEEAWGTLQCFPAYPSSEHHVSYGGNVTLGVDDLLDLLRTLCLLKLFLWTLYSTLLLEIMLFKQWSKKINK